MKSLSKFQHFHSRKCIWKCRLWIGGHVVSASMCYNAGLVLNRCQVIIWSIADPYLFYWYFFLRVTLTTSQHRFRWWLGTEHIWLWYHVVSLCHCTSKMPTFTKMQFIWSQINSLTPGRSQCDFENVIFNLALLIGIFKSSYDNVLRWMPQNLTDDRSTLVQVMAWCHQATSHCLNQC